MQLDKNLLKMFQEFQKLPIGYVIDDPEKLILLDVVISKEIQRLIKSNTSIVFFTRKSLKHISEKNRTAKSFLEAIQEILQNPDEIHRTSIHRFIFSKLFHSNTKKYRPHAVSLEVKEENIIITSFITNKTYLKNFEILWRTEIPKGGPSISI